MPTHIKIGITVLFLLAATLATTTVSAAGQTPRKFVGTYYTDGGAMVSIQHNGTMEHIVDNTYSRNNRKVTPALGNWEMSGWNEIKVTWVRFGTEEYGDNFAPNGLISRISYRMKFDRPVRGKAQSYKVTSVLLEQFLPGQNPATDEPILSVDIPSVTHGTRLQIE